MSFHGPLPSRLLWHSGAVGHARDPILKLSVLARFHTREYVDDMLGAKFDTLHEIALPSQGLLSILGKRGSARSLTLLDHRKSRQTRAR